MFLQVRGDSAASRRRAKDASAGTPIPQALLDRPGEHVGLVGLPEYKFSKSSYVFDKIYIYI